MKPPEEDPTPEDVTRADALARASLIDASATAAIAASPYARYERLLRPHVAQKLAAINRGDGDGYTIVAVDGAGAPRVGPRGPMGAREALDELIRDHPEWVRVLK